MRRQNWKVSLGVALLVALAVVPAQGQLSRAELLKASNIVFSGTVEQLGAVSFAGVPESPRTLVVRVETVFEKPPAVSLVQGNKVTIEVKDPSVFREGVRATFYTDGWIFGDGVAVREVGHEISEASAEGQGDSVTREELAQARQELRDAELKARIQAADMVVAGVVSQVGPATMEALGGRQGPITEHDPNWQEAIIQVESPIKGAQANQRVVVRFPASMDVAWYGVPRFKQGQRGTFFLKEDRVSGTPRAMLAGTEVNAYTALSTEDVMPESAADRVRALASQ